MLSQFLMGILAGCSSLDPRINFKLREYRRGFDDGFIQGCSFFFHFVKSRIGDGKAECIE